jgi:dihydroorotate dehydrogenase
MRIGSVDFPSHVLNASGARGFFGEGYRLPHPGILADWSDSVFVSKTCTLEARAGNMPMLADGVTPRERIPQSIIVEPVHGHVLNCVNLSNPGASVLLGARNWRGRRDPFVISFMAVGDSRADRLREWKSFLAQHDKATRLFLAQTICEVNISCPNTEHDPRELVGEVMTMLDIAKSFGVKVIVNINLLVTPHEAVEIKKHPYCAAVSQSNSIPWDHLPREFRRETFGAEVSPLKARGFGSGGYSGPFAFGRLIEWILEARMLDQGSQWLIVGGGIQSVKDADQVCRVGFNMLLGIKLGVVCIVRPWRVQPIIRHVNAYFDELDRTKKRKIIDGPERVITRRLKRELGKALRSGVAFVSERMRRE